VQVRAAIVDAPGSEPRVGAVDALAHIPGTTLLEVSAAPLNPLDLLIASGNFHSARHETAYVPGSECVGTVLESDAFAVGTVVYAECHASPATPGCFAAQVRVDDSDVIVLPSGVDPTAAAAIGNSGIAAYLPLMQVAGVKAGETVLVLGATGAVGQLAVQIARLKGAGQVIGLARDRPALGKLAALGADAVVALKEGESVMSSAPAFVQRPARSTSSSTVFTGLRSRPRFTPAHSTPGSSTSGTRQGPSPPFRPDFCAAGSSP
jgi:NADPH:quinone reductase